MFWRTSIVRAGPAAPGLRGMAITACLAALLSAAACDSLPPRSTVEIVTGEWPPFTEQAAAGQGTLTEVVSAAITGMGYRPRYRFVPFYDAKELARKPRIVGTFPWFEPTGPEEQGEWILVEHPLLEVEYVFFSRRDRLQQEDIDPGEADSLDDLDALVLGGVAGYTYSPEVEATLDRRFPSEHAAFRSLFDDRQGSVDVVQASREVGMHLVTGPFAAEDVEIVILDRGALDTPPQPAFFLVNPAYPDAERFAREFAAELAQIERAGFPEGRSDAAPRVRLTGAPGTPGVPAHRQREGTEADWILPHGSAAVVVEWAPSHQGDRTADPEDEATHRCRVRLLEEPHRGLLVWVAGRHLHREERGR